MSVEVGESEKNKPEAVQFQNKIKCGVNGADQMVRQYSFKAGGCRWPVAVFYNILDLAGINAFVLYKKRTADKVSCSGLLQNYVKTILLKDQAKTPLLLDLTHYRQLIKTKAENVNSVKQLQTSLNTRLANFALSVTKLYVANVPPRSFPNKLYLRQ